MIALQLRWRGITKRRGKGYMTWEDSVSPISEELGEEVEKLLCRMNRGYWKGMYWELQDDGAALFVRVSLDESQNNRKNVLAVCAILRTVMSTLLPSNPHRTTWAASVEYQEERVAGVLGGLGEDWRTLGTYGGLDEDVLWA